MRQIGQVFEILMMVAFGLSWPNNIATTLKNKSTKGKSLPFLLLIDSGYLCGIIGNILSSNLVWYVMFFSVRKNLLLIYYSHDICCRAEQNALFYKSAKRLCPNQNIQLVELLGEHCSGSSMINAVGEYDYNRALIKFISDSKN